MAISETVTTLFLETLQKWVAGALNRDGPESEFQISQLRACSPMLVANPELEFRDNGVSSGQAFEHMMMMLEAVTQARVATANGQARAP